MLFIDKPELPLLQSSSLCESIFYITSSRHEVLQKQQAVLHQPKSA